MKPRVYDTHHLAHMSSINNAARMGIISTDRAELSRSYERYSLSRVSSIFKEAGVDYIVQRDEPMDLGLDTARFTYLGKSSEPIEQMIDDELPSSGQLTSQPVSRQALENDQPVVLKNVAKQCGVDKFLLETAEQKEKALTMVESRPKILQQAWRLQPYIEPVDQNRPASLRVVTSATGIVMGAAVIVRRVESSEEYIAIDDKSEWSELAQPSSELFIRSRAIGSNASLGGRVIALSTSTGPSPVAKAELSFRDAWHLRKLGLATLTLPESTEQNAIEVSRAIGAKLAVTLGVDYLPLPEGGFQLLEVNPHPGLETFRAANELSSAMTGNDIQDRLLQQVAEGMANFYKSAA